MYLKYLTIKDQDNAIIRHVDFKIGVNIIEGNTTTENAKSNTNSIGKTTLLRSLDFCLAGKWESLVYDKELKNNRNNTVFDFFHKTSPNFELVLTKSLAKNITSQIKINRILTIEYGKKGEEKVTVKNFINNNEVNDNDFKNQLLLYLFGLKTSLPTFRQLIPKFIRASDYQVSNIVRYLHPTTSNAIYELLHLTLFGFIDMGLVNKRIALENDLKQKTEQVKSLKSLVSIGTQEVNDLRLSQLEELQNKYDSYQISKEYERENDQLNLLKDGLEQLKIQINNAYTELEVWKNRLREITSEEQVINIEAVKYMYQEAELYNVNLQKKFEETIQFHQKMLQNEVVYINSAMEKVSKNIQILELTYSEEAEKYSGLLKKLGNSGSLKEYTDLGNQINQLTKEISESEAILNTYNSALEVQLKLRVEIEKLTEELNEAIKEFRVKLKVFNEYFSVFSKMLNKDGYLLVVDEDKNHHFSLSPRPVDGDSHVGDGHKQSIIIAFDLAYVAYANNPTINLMRPHFFTQDKVEIVDSNSLAKLSELAEKVECQFIFPIIKDKLDKLPDFNKENIILTLDENNKFFNIESYYEKKKYQETKLSDIDSNLIITST